MNLLQSDLLSFNEYCIKNELKLNADKTEHLRIESRKSNLIGYSLNNTVLKCVESHKHLGITYDKKMTFYCHTNDMVMKAFSKFNLLKNICHNVNASTFLKLYKTYIMPIIEY